MRLEGKLAIIVGAGQSPGEGIGNGRATTLRFAQEGARILAVDRIISSAEETASTGTPWAEHLRDEARCGFTISDYIYPTPRIGEQPFEQPKQSGPAWRETPPQF